MRALLDTHAFLWWITGSPKLSSTARSIIADPDNRIYLSAASGWEIAIKAQIGRLTIPGNAQQFVLEQIALNSLTVMPVRMEHALQVYSLPLHHRDPFDRMLIAQSQIERMPLLTVDPRFADYDVEIVW